MRRNLSEGVNVPMALYGMNSKNGIRQRNRGRRKKRGANT